ncbi:MAG TPA: NAD(P)/FAD-dependent oxidoreductase, partial [Burkholderiales bacterium]|nr:NAD(P)/FAD-dependent oxidoreductase [Burkholderiales bacterium]
SMDLYEHDLDYLAQARWHHFEFQLGRMDGLDRARRVVKIGPTFDEERNEELIPRREIAYDTLVIAVGTRTNDFGTAGAREHAISLDTPEDAEYFHRRLINACIRANAQKTPLRPEQLHVAIVGAGATGVELAAELHKTTRQLVAYGFEEIDPERDIQMTIVEAGPRILPALPERVALAAHDLLRTLKVDVLTNEPVTEIRADAVVTASGRVLPVELSVWAAGIKAPDFLKDLDGLEVNRINQLVVEQTLQTTRDPHVFAMGDCACCPWPDHAPCVPARAQAAHQEASHLVRNLEHRIAGRPLRPFVYRDFGSLVSMGEYSTVGSLMGKLLGGAIFVEGLFARIMYISLYRMHLYALHGAAKVVFDTLGRLFTQRTEPRVKLH